MRKADAGAVFSSFLLTFVVLLMPAAARGQLDAEEETGRRIFVDGVGPEEREITAVIEGGAELPAALLPCASCHGEDGRGRPEGGIHPSDVTWPALTRPYEARRPSGREHPPYDDYLIRRAVTLGVDPAGNSLHVAMPRYQLTHEEARALVAYLKKLGHAFDPGIGETGVRVGVMLPPDGPLAPLSRAVRGVLEAAAGRLNRAGGVYNRTLELVFLESGPLDDRSELLERFVIDEEIFALSASYIAGEEATLTEVLRTAAVPLVGPFAIEPRLEFPLNPQVFYLLSGLPQQARVLVDFAAGRFGEDLGRRLVVHPRSERLAAVVEALRSQGELHGWDEMRFVDYVPGTLPGEALTELARAAPEAAVFFLGSENETAAFLHLAAQIGWRPRAFFLNALSGRGVFAAAPELADRLFLAFPSLATDTTERGFAGYRELAMGASLGPEHLASQLQALASFELLVEGLKRSGRELSRAKLIRSLEGLYDKATELTPALSFGPNRRIGAWGAYVVSPDLAKRRFPNRGEWIALDALN